MCADCSPKASGNSERKGDPGTARRLSIGLEPFAWEALGQEAARLGVSIEELASFSILYYLADCDSGRIARQPPTPPPAVEKPHPLGKLLHS